MTGRKFEPTPGARVWRQNSSRFFAIQDLAGGRPHHKDAHVPDFVCRSLAYAFPSDPGLSLMARWQGLLETNRKELGEPCASAGGCARKPKDIAGPRRTAENSALEKNQPKKRRLNPKNGLIIAG